MDIGDMCVLEYKQIGGMVTIPIKMSINAVYDMIINTYTPRTSSICNFSQYILYIRPNGNTYTNQFYFSSVYRGSSGGWNGETTESAFRIGSIISNGYWKIYNMLNNRRIFGVLSIYGNSSQSTAGIDSISGISCV